ncbi:peptidylprolyl isomerase [Persicimonas caeni]|nr:peptidylprolyl isomerase [Persicimonas caeni]
MRTTKWLVLLLAALVVLAGCDKKAEQAEEKAAAEQKAEADKAEETEEPEEPAEQEQAAAADEEKAEEVELGEPDPKLMDPSKLDEKAPETFKAKFETTKGDFVIEFRRDWAPNGADRAYNLIKSGYYDGIAFFRVMPNFMAQFGIHNHPKVNEAWKEATIEADPVKKSNTRGFVSFAQRSKAPERPGMRPKSDPTTRTTHMFINYGDNSALDQQDFTPVGKVVEGMEVVDKLYSGYGGGPPTGPNQKLAMEEGLPYLKKNFPRLDYIEDASVVEQEQ